MSTFLAIQQGIARILECSGFFSAEPPVPVIVADALDVATRIREAAGRAGGAWLLVGIGGGGGKVGQEVPGPDLRPAAFFVEVNEVPLVWRSKTGRPPPAGEMTEAALRLLHLATVAGPDGAAIAGCNGPLQCGAPVGPREEKGVVSMLIPLSVAVTLSTEPPARQDPPVPNNP